MTNLQQRMMTVNATGGPDLTEVRRYGTPAQRPTVRIQIYPGVMTYEDMYALDAADGAPIAATAPGTWGQLYAAGRM